LWINQTNILQSYSTTFKKTINTKMQSFNHNLLTQTRTSVVFGLKVAHLNEIEDGKHEPIFFFLRLRELGGGLCEEHVIWVGLNGLVSERTQRATMVNNNLLRAKHSCKPFEVLCCSSSTLRLWKGKNYFFMGREETWAVEEKVIFIRLGFARLDWDETRGKGKWCGRKWQNI